MNDNKAYNGRLQLRQGELFLRDRQQVICVVVLGLAWIAFVLVNYFRLIIHLPVLALDIAAVLAKVNPIRVVPAAMFLSFGVIVWLLPEYLVKWVTATAIALVTVALLLSAADHLLWFKAIIFFGSAGLVGLGAKRIYDKLFSADVPFWAGLVLALILFHYWLFVIGLLGIFRLAVVLPFVLALVGMGLLELYSRRRQYVSQLLHRLRSLSRVQAIFVVGLWAVLAAGFIGACAPETYSDGMRMHVPFMSNVVRDGALKPNYYTYSHIMLSPIQLLGAGAYVFMGEIGAKWLTFLMGVLCIAIVALEVSHFTGRRSIGLATGFLIISMPFFWQWLTTTYYDLPLTGLCMAGLAAMRRSLRHDPKFVPLVGLFLGFAAATKLTTVLFVAPALLVIFLSLLFTRNKPLSRWLREFWRTWRLAMFLFLLAMLPWYLLIWRWTGNPVFPALNTLFPSPYLTEGLKAALIESGKPLWIYPNGWLDAVIYPWTLTFQTHFFCETLDGALGPWFLVFFPAIPLGFLVNRLQGDRRSNGVMAALLVIAIMDIAFNSIHIPQLRYLMPGFFLLLISALGLAWKNILPLLRPVIPSQAMLLGAISLVSISLLLLFAWGVSVNFGGGLPWRVYAGYETPDQYLEARTGGVDLYINHNIRPGESVLCTDFEQLNAIHSKAIYFSYFMTQAIGLKTVEQFETFFAKNNARYWIVNRTGYTAGFQELGLAQKYLTRDRLVGSFGPVDLYTLKPELEPSPPETFGKVPLSSELRSASNSSNSWLLTGTPVAPGDGRAQGRSSNQLYVILTVPQRANYVIGEVIVKPDRDGATTIAHQVWLRQDGQEINRCVSTVIGDKNSETVLPIGCQIPSSADSLSVIVQPWRPEDGVVQILGGEIRWEKRDWLTGR